MKQFAAMFKARTMEFVRDRGTFFWNLLFPIVLVFGFAFAFSGRGQELFTVGIVTGASETAPDLLHFLEIEQIEFVEYPSVATETVVERLRRHQLDMVLDLEQSEYYVNVESPNGPIIEMVLGATGGVELERREVTGEPIRYVDWLVPGVIGMNMMFSCLFGVGFVIVRYRKNGVLKRLKATPVSALTFVTAQAASRLVIVVATSIFVFAGTDLFLKFMMNGSYLNLLLITTLSILCMISVGLVFASRLRSEELTSGLMNLVTLPMIILSGVFFSLEGSPPVMQRIARAFPLTHFTEASRAIMLDGAGFLEILPNVFFLVVLTVALLLIAALLFKWE